MALRGQVWPLPLILAWILLGVCEESYPLHARLGGHRLLAVDLAESQLHRAEDSQASEVPQSYLRIQDLGSQASVVPTERDHPEASDPRTLLERCGVPSRGCESFLGELRRTLRNRFRLWLLGVRQAQLFCSELCQTWFAICRADLTCHPAWLPTSGKGGCGPSCRTYGQTFADWGNLCRSVQGPAPPVAAPGSHHCLSISTSVQPHPGPQRRARDAVSFRRAPRAEILQAVSSGSGSGSDP